MPSPFIPPGVCDEKISTAQKKSRSLFVYSAVGALLSGVSVVPADKRSADEFLRLVIYSRKRE